MDARHMLGDGKSSHGLRSDELKTYSKIKQKDKIHLFFNT